MRMSLLRFLINLFVLISISQYSVAQTSASSGLAEKSEELEYCATYLPCAIAVGIMDTAVQGMELTDRVKNFFSSVGRRPAKTETEFKEWLITLSPSERQRLVSDCTKRRGADMLSWCQEGFLTPSELQAAKPNPVVENDDRLRFDAQIALNDLRNRDEQAMMVLRASCRLEAGRPNYGCNSQIDNLNYLYRGELSFNDNRQHKRLGISFASRSAKFIAQYFYWDTKNPQWIAKEQTSEDLWKNLPSRGSSDSLLDKQLSAAVISNAAPKADSLFSDTSNRLSAEAINVERDNFRKSVEEAKIFTQTMLVAAQQLANQQLQQSQLEAQRVPQATSNSSIQRIFSDDPSKEYIPATPEGQRIYSDNLTASRSNQGGGSSSSSSSSSAAQQMSTQSNAGRTTNTSLGGTSGKTISCREGLDGLMNTLYSLKNRSDTSDPRKLQMQQVWTQHKYQELGNKMGSTCSDFRSQLDSGLKQAQVQCRSSGFGSACVNGSDELGWSSHVDAKIASIAANSLNGVTSADSGQNVAVCEAARATQEKEFEAMNRRPLPAGSTPPLRRVMYATSEVIRLVREKCPNTPSYQAIIREHQSIYDQSRNTCIQLSIGESTCVPSADGNAPNIAGNSSPPPQKDNTVQRINEVTNLLNSVNSIVQQRKGGSSSGSGNACWDRGGKDCTAK